MINSYNGQHAFHKNIRTRPDEFLRMRAVHGTKTKHDREDGYKIARMVRGGNFPLASSIRPSGGLCETYCAVGASLSGEGPNC